ncbi:MAG: MBL fold metallo-hydrolase [Ktedonobacterales bacterium]
MRVVSLASGSSGNALLVQTGRTAVLVDAGLSARTLTSRLRQVGVTPGMLSAVLLTHEHSDHASGAIAFASQHGLPLISDPRTVAAVLEQPTAARWEAQTGQTLSGRTLERVELAVGTSTKVHDLDIRSFPVSHDAVAPCGYVLSTGAWNVCVAIDTGEAHEPMIEAMRGAQLVVLEANHEKERLLAGPYPWHLKRRILGATGHLSNEQASQALLRVVDDSPCWVWLAHLSRTNNTPDLARAQVRDALLRAGLRHIALQVAPPSVGPVWDTSALWGGTQSPVTTTKTFQPDVVAAPARSLFEG